MYFDASAAHSYRLADPQIFSSAAIVVIIPDARVTTKLYDRALCYRK